MRDHHEMARRLTYALYSADEIFYLLAKKNGQNYTEIGLMYVLDHETPLSQKDLAEQLCFPATTVNTIIKNWEKEGMVVQVPVEGKRREKHILLTDKGKQSAKELLDLIYQAEEDAMKKTLERYSVEFIDALEYYGNCLSENFRENQEQEYENTHQ